MKREQLTNVETEALNRHCEWLATLAESDARYLRHCHKREFAYYQRKVSDYADAIIAIRSKVTP